jgi:hypothetical protein
MLLKVKDIVLASFSWVMCDAIPCSVILFWIKMKIPTVSHLYDSVKKVVTLDSIPFQQLL